MTDWLESINPATEAMLARFPPATPDEVETAIAEADPSQQAWRRTSFNTRAAAMRRLAAHLRDRRDDYARLITFEMGKPIAEAVAEIEKCAPEMAPAGPGRRVASPHVIDTPAPCPRDGRQRRKLQEGIAHDHDDGRTRTLR